jgi:NADPH:quinone reductase-like Zn-dependent oxidoreductase
VTANQGLLSLRNLVILNQAAADSDGRPAVSSTVNLSGVPVTISILETPAPRFDADAPHRARKALVRVRAISCSFRDQSVIFEAALAKLGNTAQTLGTEFVAEVVAVGREVDTLRPGDRVIPVSYYPDDFVAWENAPPSGFGLPTQSAASELNIIDYDRLLRIPDTMSDEVAACFSTCAQTAYAMVRRAKVPPRTTAVVTAPNSSTSLFIMLALIADGVDVVAVGTSRRHEDRLRALGVREIVEIDPLSSKALLPDSIGRVITVFDVFGDLYLRHAIRWLSNAGRYVTCGVVDQHHRAILNDRIIAPTADLSELVGQTMTKNLTIMGSCLGMPADLQAAVDDYASGRFRPQPDSVFSGDQVGDYLTRSYADPARFGKVVYRF